MKSKNAAAVVFAVVLAKLGLAASMGILIEKTSEMYQAPANGFKSVVGADVLELNMEGDAAAGKAHCEKMKAEGCKLVFVLGKGAAKAAMDALPGMPIIFTMVMQPAESGIKGPSVTGVSLDIPVEKQLESFKSVVSGIKKVGIVYSSDSPPALAQEMKQGASKAGLTLVEKKVAGESDVPNAIRELKGQIDALYLPPDRIVTNRDAFQFIALFTFENNLPFMAPASRFVKKGALVALMIDFEDIGKQAGKIAKKIQSGTAVSAIPVQPPETTILVLNQKTAQTIGVNIPPNLFEGSEIVK